MVPHLGDSWCTENVADHREPPQEANNDREKVAKEVKEDKTNMNAWC